MKKNIILKKTDCKYLPICGGPKIRYVNSSSGGGGNNVVCVGDVGPPGAAGATGLTGESAYEIAVENGFVGSEQDWLDSLVGPAGQQGYTLSTIPYYIKEFEGETELEGAQSKNYLTTPGFAFEATPMESIILGPPKILVRNYGEGVNVSCFVSAYDFVIKSLSFQVYVRLTAEKLNLM